MLVQSKSSNMNFIFLSRLIASLADQVLLFLIPLLVYKITGNASMSGLSFALEWLPRIISFPLSGLWCDRFKKGVLYIKTDFCMGIMTFVFLGLITIGYFDTFWLLIIMGGIVGFFSSQAQVSLELTIRNYFNESDVPKAQAKSQMCEQLSLIISPFIAGFTLQYVGYHLMFGIVGSLFFISGLLSNIIFHKLPCHNKSTGFNEKSVLASFMKGCKYIATCKLLRVLVLFSLLANFFYGVILALNPYIIKGIFLASDQTLGIMYSISGIITIIFLSLIPFLTRYFSVEQIGFFGISLFIGSATVLSRVPTFELYASFYALLIVGVMLTNVMTRTYRVKLIPADDFAVTVGIILLVIKISYPFSGLVVSIFVEQLGAQTLILWSIAGSLLIFLILWPFLNKT